MSDILERIVARTRADLAERMARTPMDALRERLGDKHTPTLGFERALRRRDLHLIAEYKPRSPSRGTLREGVTPADVIPHYDRHADAISVLCDVPHFGGGYDVLSSVRAMTTLPLLCKDFIVHGYQLLEARLAGADAVLLMASVLDDRALRSLWDEAASLGLDALVETHSPEEVRRVVSGPYRIVGVNSRDLRTMSIDHGHMFEQLATIPRDRVRVAESGFGSAADVAGARGRVDAILLGSELMSAPDIGTRLVELGW